MHHIDDSEIDLGQVEGKLQQLECQRDALAEALIEMQYGHTDKAERMAVAALNYLKKTPNPQQPG